MSTPDIPSSKETEIPMIPLSSISSALSNSVPFPSPATESPVELKESQSTASNLTSSDKLTALPTQSSPVLGRLRGARRELSASLTSIDSPPSGSLQGMRNPSGTPRMSESDGSLGRETPKQRVSFESDRLSLPGTLQSIRQVVTGRIGGHSDSGVASPSARPSDSPHQNVSLPSHSQNQSPLYRNLSPLHGKEGAQTPASPSPSRSQSRAASPLRRIGWSLHRVHSREEPFIPIDPFRLRVCWLDWRRSAPSRPPPAAEDIELACEDALTACLPFPLFGSSPQPQEGEEVSPGRWEIGLRGAKLLFIDVIAHQVYLTLLLRLPALYWSRVARVFEDAEVSKPDIQRMIDACATDDSEGTLADTTPGQRARRASTWVLPFPEDWNPPQVSPALVRFKNSWELFVDSLLREWKTLNLVSALLCTGILTMFQIEAAVADPLIRSSALVSLVFALMSLSYGCVYIVQFGTMRSMDRASKWAEEAQKSKTEIWWNIWVLLATPAVWLAWSMIAFCVSILSYLWRSGAQDDEPRTGLTPRQALGVRIAISALFGLGLVYFALIIRTFGKYAQTGLDRRMWTTRRNTANGNTGHGAADGAVDERARDRGRERKNALSEEREREIKAATGSMLGLGLTGLDGNGIGSPGSSTGIVVTTREVDLEKGDFLAGEKGRGRGRVSPRL